MGSTLDSILRIEVPIVVVLGEHKTQINNVRQWVPGSIIELAISAEEQLDMRVNNRTIGTGSAVKIGENFGVRVNSIIGKTERIKVMGADTSSDSADGEMTPDEIAEALLAGQL